MYMVKEQKVKEESIVLRCFGCGNAYSILGQTIENNRGVLFNGEQLKNLPDIHCSACQATAWTIDKILNGSEKLKKQITNVITSTPRRRKKVAEEKVLADSIKKVQELKKVKEDLNGVLKKPNGVRKCISFFYTYFENLLVKFLTFFYVLFMKSQEHISISFHRVFSFIGFILALIVVKTIFKVDFLVTFLTVISFYFLLRVGNQS